MLQSKDNDKSSVLIRFWSHRQATKAETKAAYICTHSPEPSLLVLYKEWVFMKFLTKS